jgi:hypothetical protein
MPTNGPGNKTNQYKMGKTEFSNVQLGEFQRK